ncbi:MAG TPA: hypothetical protein VMB21_12760 [Candidatus Limnocylindria bacterium]|nr:hypothetical protein [Candidatus Limnocylindria bacterium]
MKTWTLRCLLLGLALVAVGFAPTQGAEASRPEGAPARYLIGLSPFLDKSVKDDVYRRIVGFVLEDMPLGSSLAIYDAYQLQTVMQLEVPKVQAFRSSKTRANQFKEPINKLKGFLAAEHPHPEAAKLDFTQAIRFPQFMDFVGENLAPTDQPVAVIVLGSPLYLDHKEPGFSMMDGYFPSDGHLQVARDRSVFGLKDRAGALANLTVHWGYFGDPWVSAVHQEKINRFWSLYLKGQGARLATFCGDLPTVFDAVRPGAVQVAETRGQRFELDPTQTKLEMLRITRDVGVADWITRDTVHNAAQRAPSVTVGPMKIGIRWQGNLDLDLYATPSRDAEMLFFEHTRSPEGYYFKDHRSSPQREYEFIEFEAPVDVEQVDARINFFKGEAPDGVGGEVRVEFDGRIYTGHFTLDATHGNEGRTGSHQKPYWVRLDLPAILRLRPVPQTSAQIREAEKR